MKIIESFVPKSKWNIKCPYEMTPEFIVIHNTSNDASAKKEISYMVGNDNETSFHYAIDDKEIIQAISENRNTWACGDGSKGKGNRKGISIEICYSKSGGERFNKAEENTAEFVANLLKKYGWDISKVKKHQDFSNKYCPHRTLDLGWDRFLKMVEKYMFVREIKEKMTKFKDTQGHWAEKNIDKLADCGIVNGDGKGKFMPNALITRAEVATMIANALTYIGK